MFARWVLFDGSGLAHRSQASEMEGKKVLITGATDGIGKHTAAKLAKLGATVLVHGRFAFSTVKRALPCLCSIGGDSMKIVVGQLALQESKEGGRSSERDTEEDWRSVPCACICSRHGSTWPSSGTCLSCAERSSLH